MSPLHEPSADMLKKMLDAQPHSIYTFDKNRAIIYANKFARETFNTTESGKSMGAAEAGHFDVNSYYDEEGNLLPYPKGSAVERALQGEATHDLLLEHRNYKTHNHRWINISCEPVLNAQGAFEYGIMTHRDISLRKSREHKLQFLLESAKTLSVTTEFKKRLLEKVKLTVPNLADWCAIDILESNGNVTRMALVHRDPKKLAFIKEYERKYPTPKEEQQPRRVIQTGKKEFIPLITEEMYAQATNVAPEQLAEIRKLQLTSILVLPIRSKTRVYGALTLAYAESGRVYTEDDIRFFEEFCHHLTIVMENARLYEEITARDLSKDAFFASLSHELRNPLAPIKSALELLRLKNPPPSLLEDVDIIEHQFDHMTRLLTDLLDANRFIHGKIILEPEMIAAGEHLRKVVNAIEPLVQKSGIRVDIHIAEGLQKLWGDPTRLEQAFSNLLHNAVKFTSEGGSMQVRAFEEGGMFCFVVKDSGIGITQKEMPRIFEPYYQSDRFKHGNRGLGVGLRLVQEIARLHGGSIEAKSQGEGKGSEFILRLPLYAKPAAAATGQNTPSQTEPQVAGKRILVVDDNEAATDSLVKLLRVLGWEATGLYSAKAALEHLKTSQPDIILLDIGMPDMDGYELTRLLRQEHSLTIPIIAVSGYGMEEDKRKAIESGFTMHLTKPVSKDQLSAALAGMFTSTNA